MLSNQENFKNSSFVGYHKKEHIEGLDTFKKNLEKYFFSQVVLRDISTASTSSKLVLELNCNFSLVQLLHHFNLGTWGNFDVEEFSFPTLLETLRESTDFYIAIDEFSIILQNTTIIVNKIYDESIPQQLETILRSLSENYVHFTKRLTEVPYEIYVPIFEENLLEEGTTPMNIKTGNSTAQDYFKYWGLYFYSEDNEALIYDLKNTAIIPGDLKMLNE